MIKDEYFDRILIVGVNCLKNNKVNMLNNNSQSKVAKTLCGPYDSQFIKKFRGKMTRSISIDRLKLNKIAKTNHASANKNEPLTQNMLPKLK